MMYTAAQAAERLGISEYQVRSEKSRGRLPYREVGLRPLIRFTDEDLTEYQRRTKVAQEPSSLVTTRRKKRRAS